MSSDLKQVNKLKKNTRRNNTIQEPKLVERLIKISRVSKVTKGGKKLSFRAIVVVGNEKGQVGVGVAKADDVVNAFKKGKADARKNLITFPLTKYLTIPHRVSGNFGACKIIMRPSIEGSGVIAGGAIRIVLEVAGVKNVIAKQLGSNNLLNNARASICALENLTTKSEVTKKRSLTLN
jgi:small subunit ribosomal protein S5|uniref:Small ribosomal subunit protein uS5c n=1 Tax=Asterionella formosa TaxID=210441 RepID=A0A023HBE6_9STRA|nr:ribosomal protein S5 [Asterionella formosa]AGH28238.1 ribosomal protein S5 [Asterionella formosa]WGN98948.1 ribosomal protein S5 [Asterionella formosa]